MRKRLKKERSGYLDNLEKDHSPQNNWFEEPMKDLDTQETTDSPGYYKEQERQRKQWSAPKT